jgi:hypothetical protein
MEYIEGRSSICIILLLSVSQKCVTAGLRNKGAIESFSHEGNLYGKKKKKKTPGSKGSQAI